MTMETAVKAYTEGLENFRKGERRGRERGIREGRELGIREGRERGIREGRQQGIREGRQQGQAQMLRRIVAHKFGSAAEEELSGALAVSMGPDRMRLLEDAALECDSTADFLGRMREAMDRS